MKEIDADKLIKRNLQRLLEKRGMQQNRLAQAIGVVPSVINDILAGRRPMGKDTMQRLCKALDVDLWEFYWTEDTPVISDEKEREALALFREAEALGVAGDMEKYGRFRVREARHDASDTGKEKKPGMARHKRRAG